MIPRIHKRGPRTIGLLAYLYGPGKAEEHVDPHIVASFDGMAPDPGRDPSDSLKPLERVLDRPLLALPTEERPNKHVWHCSVRAAATDRVLTDQEWGDIARRIVAATGIDPDGDDAGCRWVAVRHADDHIHIIANLVREDGRRPDSDFEGKRAQAEARRIEKDLGLRELAAGDGTAAKRPTSPERHKAKRRGLESTPRELLREAVRRSLAGAADETEFFTRLRGEGVRVNQRRAPSGDIIGYTVALPGDHNADGQPIWYSGSKLAPDLSLPAIRRRLDHDPEDQWITTGTHERPHGGGRTGPTRSRPAQARRRATDALDRAAADFDEDDDPGTAARLIGVGEVLDALSQTASADVRAELRAAAREFERASRSHIRAGRADQRALRSIAREIVYAGGALGRGEDGAATATVLCTLVLITVAAARWHTAHGHAQQAAAAHATAQHLRAAYRNAAAPPMRALHNAGRALPAVERDRHRATIATALPDATTGPGDDARWDALAATLDQAERAGHDPKTLLTEATAMRELDSADNTADVLIWRLRHIAHLPAPAPRRATKRTSGPSKPAPAPAAALVRPETPQREHRR
ncbi:mobilization protein [Streptomyces sp. SID3343]|uniref:relaxase/mobilization nuclease domain-containing protein n=1 Tax=Streptomyces sp. SID3343 TaxID=2690260 RepID=UPI00136CC3B4|nr:mobilization protein [Streptomyces sp. SID3343]MYW06248.1 mobilization protein [Streptomyces sp. SID3343]